MDPESDDRTARAEKSGETVLLADDHVRMRALVRGILEQAGFDVVGEAANGLEAVELCEALRPQLVVLDISMPRMNGISAAQRIARSCPDTTIIFITQWADDHLMRQALSVGADCVVKDRAASALVPAIRAVQACRR